MQVFFFTDVNNTIGTRYKHTLQYHSHGTVKHAVTCHLKAVWFIYYYKHAYRRSTEQQQRSTKSTLLDFPPFQT